ncbi:MAG: hypothetical protein IPP53_06780 [Bacteroidetes bacterium]|nr:hypothetical protein [Bacteroidota bacterium]
MGSKTQKGSIGIDFVFSIITDGLLGLKVISDSYIGGTDRKKTSDNILVKVVSFIIHFSCFDKIKGMDFNAEYETQQSKN